MWNFSFTDFRPRDAKQGVIKGSQGRKKFHSRPENFLFLWKFSVGWKISLVEIFLPENFPRGNFLAWKFSCTKIFLIENFYALRKILRRREKISESSEKRTVSLISGGFRCHRNKGTVSLSSFYWQKSDQYEIFYLSIKISIRSLFVRLKFSLR